jgi:hypothetical protein
MKKQARKPKQVKAAFKSGAAKKPAADKPAAKKGYRERMEKAEL